jgi:hypothetical protein
LDEAVSALREANELAEGVQGYTFCVSPYQTFNPGRTSATGAYHISRSRPKARATDCPLTPVYSCGILEPTCGAAVPLEKTSLEKAIFSGKKEED